MLYDLASLTKTLVTAPLALEHLQLDRDWGRELGFHDWPGPITPRLLLSHAAGLPPWMPYTGEPVWEQIKTLDAISIWGRHPLLKKAVWGESTYSDIGFRLLAEILEIELGQDWRQLGENHTGLHCAPWNENQVFMPPGADLEAWLAATAAPFPGHLPNQPHDANARAGMKGHAGFAATPESAHKWLQTWLRKYPALMAVETNHSQDGQIWGLGLQRLKNGEGSFAELLNSKAISGIHVITHDGAEAPQPIQPHIPTDSSDWWFHFGYTGPALFVRPKDGTCVLILCHRLKNKSELLNIEELRARRWQIMDNGKWTIDN
jgi:CubicO group peptidase (beta-lactamase class C family)